MSIPTPRGKNNLSAWLAWQSDAHPKKWDLGLDRIQQVWQNLGAPRLAKKIISIAGTNGKGSCVVWAEAIAKAHQLQFASFTSPHLIDYCERIRFQGENIDPLKLCRAFDKIDTARGDISLTYFEWSALAAFLLMSEAQLDLAILEVGLGGRLDAVNMIDADAVIFTKIGLDHQNWLGDSIEEITREKAGILRNNQLVAIADKGENPYLNKIIDEYHVDLIPINSSTVTQANSTFTVYCDGDPISLNLPSLMHGEHQLYHCAAIIGILSKWFSLCEPYLNQAMQLANNVGRLTWISENPKILIDVAHNIDSATVLERYLKSFKNLNHIHIICGMLKDKDQVAVLSIMDRIADQWYLIPLTGDRGADIEKISQSAEQAHISAHKLHQFEGMTQAFQAASSNYQPGDAIIVMGSFLTVAAFLSTWKQS